MSRELLRLLVDDVVAALEHFEKNSPWRAPSGEIALAWQ